MAVQLIEYVELGRVESFRGRKVDSQVFDV